MKTVYITTDILKKVCPSIEQNIKHNPYLADKSIEKVCGYFNMYMPLFGIDTPQRAAMFLAQAMHESGGLRYTEELASGKAYEGRRDLGNVHAGDGVKYKGRGIFQLTGYNNYRDYKAFCGFDVLAMPKLIAQAPGCFRSACWFWKKRALNYYADKGDFLMVTKRINGGTNGFENRLRFYERAKAALGV